jgi:hypothetical protein
MLGWDQYKFHKKRAGTLYAELVFLHPVGYVGHLVHSSASEARNIDGLFFMLGGTGTDSTKSVLAHFTPNFSFCIRRDLRAT